MLSVIKLSVVMLSVIMLNVVMMSVVMMSFVAPFGDISKAAFSDDNLFNFLFICVEETGGTLSFWK